MRKSNLLFILSCCLGETTVIITFSPSSRIIARHLKSKLYQIFYIWALTCVLQNRFYRRWWWWRGWWRDHSSEEDEEKDFKGKFWWEGKREGKRQEVQIKRCPLFTCTLNYFKYIIVSFDSITWFIYICFMKMSKRM